MTSDMMTEFLKSCCLLAVFLLAGAILRAKVPLFRKLFLPAAVIGGFIGLLLGPRMLGSYALLPIGEEWLDAWTALPGVLVVPIFAATPLGLFSCRGADRTGKPKTAPKKHRGLHLIAVLFGTGAVIKVATSFQEIIGMGTNVVYSALHPEAGLYKTFGYELARGFAGGHGTAGVVGNLLQGYGYDYWETAQGVTTTTATVGLIAGMIIGIVAINVASRRGYTARLKKPSDIPLPMARGFETDPDKQQGLGRETTMSSSIETITTHLCLILVGCGLGYLLQSLVDPSARLPVWFFCMAAMYPVDWLLAKLHLGWLVDRKVKARIVGTLSDFAIVAAIASIPVKAVSAYLTPLIIMMVIGLTLTFLLVFGMFRWLFPDRHPFEHAIMVWGLETGVMINGMMLLRICDPDFETTALNDITMGESLMNIVYLPMTLIGYYMIQVSTNARQLLVTFTAVCAFCALLYLIFRWLYRYSQKDKAAGSRHHEKELLK